MTEPKEEKAPGGDLYKDYVPPKPEDVPDDAFDDEEFDTAPSIEQFDVTDSGYEPIE